jgi:sensor histidine kinase regulating citrate/malate metabolism
MAIPIVDSGAALGSVVIFEDATKVANLAAELAALKAGKAPDNDAKRGRR